MERNQKSNFNQKFNFIKMEKNQKSNVIEIRNQKFNFIKIRSQKKNNGSKKIQFHRRKSETQFHKKSKFSAIEINNPIS